MIFEVSDARTGYVVGLDIYTGKIQLNVQKLQTLWTQTVPKLQRCKSVIY